MDWQQATRILDAGRTRHSRLYRKVANNTYLDRGPRAEPGSVELILHGTRVLTYRPDGSVMLRTGGWYTRTTQDRLNRQGLGHVVQHRREWYVLPWDLAGGGPLAPREDRWAARIPFEDGMVLPDAFHRAPEVP